MSKRRKSLFQMTELELQDAICNTYGCLICGKSITYKVSRTRFCLDCSLKYYKQIRELRHKSRQISIVTEVYDR